MSVFSDHYKQAIARSLNADVIKEVSAQIEHGAEPGTVRLDTSLPTLRNRTVGAIVKAYKAVNNRALVLKVKFPVAYTANHLLMSFNVMPRHFYSAEAATSISHKPSLTSLEMLATLDNLPTTNKAFYDELSTPRASATTNSGPTPPSETVDPPVPTDITEEAPFNDTSQQDDCEAIPTAVIIDPHMYGSCPWDRISRLPMGHSHLCLPRRSDGPWDSDFDSRPNYDGIDDDAGSSSGYDDHASDEDWDPVAKAQIGQDALLQEVPSPMPSESARNRTQRVRKPVDLNSRFKFWQEP